MRAAEKKGKKKKKEKEKGAIYFKIQEARASKQVNNCK